MMERVGGGEAVHGEQRWRKCLHSTFRYIIRGSEIVPVCFPSFNSVVREQSAEYFSQLLLQVQEVHGVHVRLQPVQPACLCASLHDVQRAILYDAYMLTHVCSASYILC